MSPGELLESDIRVTAAVVSASRDLVVQPPASVTAMVGDAVRAKFEELAETIEAQAEAQNKKNDELQRWAKEAAEAAREMGAIASARFLEEATATDALIEKLKDAKTNGGEA